MIQLSDAPLVMTTSEPASPGIKEVPAAAQIRDRIRSEARMEAQSLDRRRPLARPALEALSQGVLSRLALAPDYLGFTMVAISNEFWHDQFAAVPYDRRVLLLPHCLRKVDACRGDYSAQGLSCAACGACAIAGLKGEAEALGYEIVVAEGTPVVVQQVLSGRADAVLGVACLDSLEKAFPRIVDLGIPHAAVPLLTNGCVETTAEVDLIRRLINLSSGAAAERTRTYVPLLRAAVNMFEQQELAVLVGPFLRTAGRSAGDGDRVTATDAIALDWLATGGKRLRPFVTLASYAALVHGTEALKADADTTNLLPEAVKRMALAIEVMHKASLAHDDIEDHDLFRYGRDTLHRRHGEATAINVGDFLIGLGYRLVAATRESLGSECVADILDHLSDAHLNLCRGQGAELFMRHTSSGDVTPIDMLASYALKTAPAFEVAMYAGVRMADAANVSLDTMKSFCRSVGVAYQILNDVQDWQGDASNKLIAGQDALSERPTILQAFALEAGDEASNREILELVRVRPPKESTLQRLREIYEERGAFAKAQQLVDKYRDRAQRLAEQVEAPVFRELMTLISQVIL